MTPENEPSLSTDEAKAIVAGKTAPKITEDGIKDRIASATYLHHDLLTICILQMVTGFYVVGHSAPASPENFDPAVGERYAFDNAFKQIWPLEGYRLRYELHQQAAAKAQPAEPVAGQATN